jgi:hypothetical protein
VGRQDGCECCHGLRRDGVRFHVRTDIMSRKVSDQAQDESMITESAAFDRASRDLRVFISNRESRCDDCGEDLGRRAMIFLAGNRGGLCLPCADLDHLTLLLPGDAALTRRARNYSTLAAVVLKWGRARIRPTVPRLPARSAGANRCARVSEVQRARGTIGRSQGSRRRGDRASRCGPCASHGDSLRRLLDARRRALGRARSRP